MQPPLTEPATRGPAPMSMAEPAARGEDPQVLITRARVGPVNSNFDGSLQVVDRVEQEGYRLLISVNGKVGTVKAEGSIGLLPVDGGTVVSFAGDAKLTGVLARMGQRVLSGVGRMFTKQFFKALEAEMNSAEQPTQIQEDNS